MLRSRCSSSIRLSGMSLRSRVVYAQRQFHAHPNVSRWTPDVNFQTAAIRNRSKLVLRANFHTTPSRQQFGFGALLAGVLKASGSIEVARCITKVVLTFVPIIAVKNYIGRKFLKVALKEYPQHEHKRTVIEKRLRKNTISYRTLVAIPIVLFGLTFFASLERTPLSGRWRVILLSPEEEDSILQQLQGDGWYRAVLEVISQDGPPNVIPPTDWRYQVVESVLRRLEGTIPILAVEKQIDVPWLDRGPDDLPLPPPAKYPLKPRPSAKEYLRWFCDNMSEPRKTRRKFAEDDIDSPHLVPGPPYNLIVVDRPECDNAFSFGFGPDGGGGIVVYSGFLNRIFGLNGAASIEDMKSNVQSQSQAPLPTRSMVSEFIGSLLAFSPPLSAFDKRPRWSTVAARPQPTEEQITELAILLSHELSHLILSHHLESLSAGTVFIPGTVSLFADLIRAVLFPITMIFGPFVNDAVANWGKVGAGEFAKLTESCTSMNLEFEADAVSARILAHAGFDARAAIYFWKHRSEATLSEVVPSRAAENARFFDNNLVVTASDDSASLGIRLARKLMSVTHPAHKARLLRLKSELQRWETERARALRKRARKLKKMKKMRKHGGHEEDTHT